MLDRLELLASAKRARLGEPDEARLAGFLETIYIVDSNLSNRDKIKHAIFEDKGETDKAEAMQAVIDAVDEWESGNIATEREFFQDVLNWPDRLFTDLQFLYSTLDGALPRVTEGMKKRHADLEGRFEDAMNARDAVMEGSVAAANRTDDDILVVPEMGPAR